MKTYTQWADIPDNLATKTQLGRDGLKPAPGQKPIASKVGGYGPYKLYDRTAAVPKRRMTPAQKAAAAGNLEKARAALYCADCGQYLFSRHFRGYLDENGRCRDCRERWLLAQESKQATASLAELAGRDDWLILDTETTGLDDEAEVVQIGIVDAHGEVIMDQLIKPSGDISAGAAAVHGLDTDMLATAPVFADVYRELCGVVNGRYVLAYNADFDSRMLRQTCKRFGLPVPAIAEWTCIMELYAAHFGELHRSGNFRWQSLVEACLQQEIQIKEAHNAAGDALLTWQLIRSFA